MSTLNTLTPTQLMSMANTAGALIVPQYNKALKAGDYLYKNRKSVKRAARTIGKAYKSYKRRKTARDNIGYDPGMETTKRTLITNTNDFKSTRVLYSTDLTDIGATGNNAVNARQRDMLYMSGTKLCFELGNARTKPLYVNIAVVHSKKDNDTVGSIGTGDFFRSNGNGRAQTFSDALSSLEFHCLPINSDRFNVLTHKRMVLDPVSAASGYSATDGKSFTSVGMWVPVKRQIRFNGGEAQSKIWLIYWFDEFDTPQTDLSIPNAVKVSEHHVTYFKEPK